MGVLFNRNNATEAPIVKRDTLIFDFMRKIEKDLDHFQALYIYVTKLQNQSMKGMQRQTLIETFENVTKKSGGELFGLPNDDVVIIFNQDVFDEIQACLVKLRFLFHDDPLIRNADDLEAIHFVRFFPLSNGAPEFREVVKSVMKIAPSFTDGGNSFNSAGSAAPATPSYMMGQKKLRKELTPSMLGKVQKILSTADFSSFIRRQAICAVIGKSPPQRVFEEVYVSIPDLRDMLLPDVDLTANPWLFLSLSETLDKRVLETISRHDDGSLTGNFSINVNVSTILSDDFLEFDENISASMRPSIVLELQLVDIFSDIKAFVLAKTFAQSRGYKVCIDGITVDKLKYLNRENLNCDLVKIIWHPTFMDVIHEDEHFMDYVNKSERAKMILCRIDDPQAVVVGNSLGINLYQGRYIQRMLNSQPRKTIFEIKR